MTKHFLFIFLVPLLISTAPSRIAQAGERPSLRSCKAIMLSVPQLTQEINALHALILELHDRRIMAHTSTMVVTVPALNRGGTNTMILERGGKGWRSTLVLPNQRPDPRLEARAETIRTLDEQVTALISELNKLVQSWIDASVTTLIAPLVAEYLNNGTINVHSMQAVRAGVLLGDLLPFRLEQAVKARARSRRTDKVYGLGITIRDNAKLALEAAFAAIAGATVYTARVTEMGSTAMIGVGTFQMPPHSTLNADKQAKHLTGALDAIATFSSGYSLQMLLPHLASGNVAFEGVFHRENFDLAALPPAVLMKAQNDDFFLNPMLL